MIDRCVCARTHASGLVFVRALGVRIKFMQCSNLRRSPSICERISSQAYPFVRPMINLCL
jgi:hypothetical protein